MLEAVAQVILSPVRLVALVLALAIGDPRLQTAEAQASFAEAEQAFAAKDFDRAADALARVYAIEPLPHILYAQAQAERLAGRCAKASPLYIEYLDTLPSPDSAALVQWNLSVCLATMSLDASACSQAETQIDTLRSDADGDATRSKQVLELEVRLEACRAPESIPEPVPEGGQEPEPEPPSPTPTPLQVEPAPPIPPQRPRVDPWGVALGSLALLSAGGAVGSYLAGTAQIDAVSLEGTHSRARERQVRGRSLQGVAIGAAAVAGGLAVGAVVHWMVWRRRPRASAARRR